MTKYYRVIKDTPLWKVGAILEKCENGRYEAVEDIWDKVNRGRLEEYGEVVEGNPDFFQRVYKNEGNKLVYRTAEQLEKIYKSFVE